MQQLQGHYPLLSLPKRSAAKNRVSELGALVFVAWDEKDPVHRTARERPQKAYQNNEDSPAFSQLLIALP